MLVGSTEELLAFAVDHCPIDPTFAPFVSWCREREVEVRVVSDGFAFYIKPMLIASGIEDVPIEANTWTQDAEPRLAFERGHEACRWCGTCKVGAVARAREGGEGAVAFIGEGGSDRLGAAFADVAFAKDVLRTYLAADGVPFVEWSDFSDVQRALTNELPVREPSFPDGCEWGAP
jgi:2-hydroxy-3-keto-5-methylthiopentenyl-1-phosphate phosphatase